MSMFERLKGSEKKKGTKERRKMWHLQPGMEFWGKR